MTFGQINPLNFLVAQRLAANQNVDSSTATRHALVGTLLGEGIIGPIVARQLAIRDAAPAPVAVSPGTRPPAGSALEEVNVISNNLTAWHEAEKKRDADSIKRGKELLAEAEKRRTERTRALRTLCESLGALGTHDVASAVAEEAAPVGSKKKPE